MKFKGLLIALATVLLFFQHSQGQNNVGIGTTEPNPNAVLELVSPNNNQGLLVPRLTTSQREGMSGLTNSENGLMVYDTDENQFFYWHSGQWNSIISLGSSSSGLITGTGISINGNTVSNTGDLDSLNELQELGLNEDELTLSKSGVVIDLSKYSNSIENQNAQEVAIQPTGGLTSTTVQTALEELQIEIESDEDPDVTNEIQDLELTGDKLIITNNNTATEIDLLPYKDNTDEQEAGDVPVSPVGNLSSTDVQTALEELQSDIDSDIDDDPTNEIQTAATVNVSPSGNLGSGNVQAALEELQADVDADIDQDPTNEIQTAAQVNVTPNTDLTSTEVQAALVELQSEIIADPDQDPLNEIQVAATVDVTPSGNLNSDNVQDALVELQLESDADTDQNPTNEIQDLTLSSDNLIITNNPSATNIDLTPYLDNTDDQQLALNTNQLSLEDGGAVDLSGYLDNTDDQQLALNTNQLSLEDGGTVDLSSYLDNTDEQQLDLEGNTLSLGNGGSVDLAGYLDNTDDQQLALNTNQLSLEDGGTVDLSGYLDNTDAQQLGLAGNNLSLDNSVSVDLAGYLDNTDNQQLTLNTNQLSLEDGGTVDLSGYLDNTDEQQLDLAGNTLSLGNGGSVDLTGYLDNTDNQNASQVPVAITTDLTSNNTQAALEELQGEILLVDQSNTNEFQDLSIATDVISLSNSSSTVDLSPYLDNTDSQDASQVPVATTTDLSSNNTQAALEELQTEILLADQSNSNELQTLSLATRDLTISSASGNTVSLVPVINNSSIQELSDVAFSTAINSGDILVYNGSNWDIGSDQVGLTTVSLNTLTDVDPSGVTDGQVLQYDALNSGWFPVTPTSSVNSLNDLSDATISTPVSGEVVSYNGTAWVDRVLEVEDLNITLSSSNSGILSSDDGNWEVLEGTNDGDIVRWNSTGVRWESGRYFLDDIGDVSVVGALQDQVLRYDPDGGWFNGFINASEVQNLGTTITSQIAATTIGTLLDVDGTSLPSDNDVLIYDGTNSEYFPGTLDLDNLGNVGLFGSLDGTVLSWNGEDTWVASRVNGFQIQDNTIRDEDVNTNAAIAGTKVNPNFGTQDVVTSGNLVTTSGTVTAAVSIPTPTRRVLVISGTTNMRTIGAGQDGQELILIGARGSSFFISTADQAQGNIILENVGAIQIDDFDTITLVYSTALGAWIETARSENAVSPCPC